jgi:hypothetical protein
MPVVTPKRHTVNVIKVATLKIHNIMKIVNSSSIELDQLEFEIDQDVVERHIKC